MAALPLTRFERILFKLALLLGGMLVLFRLCAMIFVSYLHHAR